MHERQGEWKGMRERTEEGSLCLQLNIVLEAFYIIPVLHLIIFFGKGEKVCSLQEFESIQVALFNLEMNLSHSSTPLCIIPGSVMLSSCSIGPILLISHSR